MDPYHILVVEDDEAMRKVIRDILEINGYHTYPAENGQDALETLEWLRADLIISDIMMPIMDGYDFYDQVRARQEWLHIPFMFLTARGTKPDILVGKQLGADDYLTKPFDAKELLVAVSSKLSIAERWKQVQQQEIAAIKRNILRALNHEFRTPLTYISAYTEILAESGGQLSEEDFQEFCQGILLGSRRLQTLIEDFLFLVQVETGEARTNFLNQRARINNWAGFLDEVIIDFKEKAQQKHLQIEMRLANNLRPVLASSEYLTDALGRLLSNAIKFSGEHADPITIRADMVEDNLRLAITDHGIGIRPDAIPGIFDMLYQVDRDRMEQQGSGSGLAIAKSIITLHGGEIYAESQLGEGSTFTVLLPTLKE